MPSLVSKEMIRFLRGHFVLDWQGVHGAPHWARVQENGLRLAEGTGANTRVIELFAFLHDSCRENEWKDHGHGHRGAALAATLQGRFFTLEGPELVLLQEACKGHSDGGLIADITVQTCWDADRLDLGRVGVRPSADRLCTGIARDPVTIEWAYRRSISRRGMG